MNKAVIYTDGSARPNPGFGGWGFHGYLYSDEGGKNAAQPPKYKTTSIGYATQERLKVEELELVKPYAYIDAAGPLGDMATNNIGEATAIHKVFEYFLQNDEEIDSLVVNTDSEYVINGCKRTLEETRSTDKPIANPEIWFDVITTMQELQDKGVSIDIRKVKAHDNYLGNNIADDFALVGVYMSKEGHTSPIIVKHPAAGYWRVQDTKHPLLCYNTLFVPANKITPENNTVFHFFNADSKLPYGKSHSKATYCTLWSNEPNVYIQMVLGKFETAAKTFKAPAIMRLDVLYNLRTQMLVRSFGSVVFTDPDRKNTIGVYLLGSEPVLKMINPPGLSFTMENKFSKLGETLDAYRAGRELPDTTNIDITELVLNDLDTKEEMLKVKTEQGLFKLIYKKDMPPKNVLKKLKKSIKNIVLTVTIDGDVKRYGVIVDTGDTLSIWHNVFAAFTI